MEPEGKIFGKVQHFEKQCGDSFRRFRSRHDPMPVQADTIFWENNNVVTMLRHPVERIISGFLHDLHDCSSPDLKGIRPRMPNGYLSQEIFKPDFRPHLEKYFVSYWLCVQGCATRMILGATCGDNFRKKPLILPHVNEALKRMEKFAFVGIQEKWDDSIKKFKEQYGGNYSNFVYINNRKTRLSDGTKDILRAIVVDKNLQDEADELLYKFALSRLQV